MGFDVIVLAKQVPDTANITGDAMKPDGTVNRAALPAIFNPEDLNALEMALEIRERHGGTVTLVTMGPPRAGELLREALYRGADRAILLTDRRFAVGDTLATSYSLACAVKTLGKCDLVLCGRQAIDGDTAQVGPQTAEKLDVPQMTYVDRIEELTRKKVVARRSIGRGYERVEAKLPCLLTVMGSANEPRPPAAKLLLRYKHARVPSEVSMNVMVEQSKRTGKKADEAEVKAEADRRIAALKKRKLLLEEWKPEDIDAELNRIGYVGSPTRVKNIEFVVIKGADTKMVEPTDEGIGEMLRELVADHTLG
jgi:electron transfer flavoprotein beta subunit